MASYLLNILGIVLFVPYTLLCSLSAIVGYLINERLGHFVQRIWAKGTLALMGIQVTVRGLEKLDPFRNSGLILAPNHQSYFDIMVLGALPIDFKWVSKTEVAKIPFIGAVLRTMGSFLVRRDQSGQDLNVMREVEDALRNGKRVLIFPEGTRTRTGSLLPFKKGAFRTAQNAEVPIVPIGLRGTYGIAPPGKKIPHGRNHQVLVTVGEPYRISKGEPFSVSTETLREKIITLL